MTSDSLFQIAVTDSDDGHVLGNTFLTQVLALLKQIRGVDIAVVDSNTPSQFSIPVSGSIFQVLSTLCTALSTTSRHREAETFKYVLAKCVDSKSFGGLGLSKQSILQEEDRSNALFLVEVWLEALNSQDRVNDSPSTIATKSHRTKPMTLSEKIFAHHTIGGCPVEGLKAGDVVRVSIDWVIASELTWTYMYRTMEEIGAEKIWRNDRFWLAGDHVVDPRVYKQPKVKALIQAVEKANKDYKMTDYQGLNYTIMHTEFVRERVEPGMLILGADSHTCSSGAVGCLAIGLGAGDVVMGLVTGETWMKIPECILITFTGKPAFGMGGKDVILYILKELKRNTVAADRIVEFSGDGLKYLSCDARFAIANMCAELGAVSGIFAADEITYDYVSRRRQKIHRSHSIYFQADADAVYAGKYTIDLSRIESFIALYPAPDNVVPVSKKEDMHLDGVFIGACTTTEEDLVLAALVLQVGLKKGLPQAKGRKHVAPGSLPIIEKLRSLGLLEVYEAAGFIRSPPGCSFCVGMGSDKAGEGETWLSSQNRNFKHRMGKNAFGSITSAIVVAASSFSMKVTDPASFLADMDVEFFRIYKNLSELTLKPVLYVEPHTGPLELPSANKIQAISKRPEEFPPLEKITSKIVVLGDFIDTDAIAPSEFLIGPVTDEELGLHCLQYTHPDFREKVKNGQRIVVAGKAFGCGSSRQHAVGCLSGAGVQAVIARSFSFIYGRNQPTLGLLGIIMSDEAFFTAATENADIEIDVPRRKIFVAGQEFGFVLADMEYWLTMNKGMNEAYKKFGTAIWEKLTEKSIEPNVDLGGVEQEMQPLDNRLRW
ncbi:putative aconitate hydratase [Lachnellula subtilissima]|uniref:Putative aconitate hydratase n=1 Tax=Lachnellula subtilissima TaxID=602034 RepID=A0A8H8UI80_9HELO|nr:putative aconitate hydratase [Lachnellula subtilissima]